MGMPEFFRWLIRKYPSSFVKDCIDGEKSTNICDNFYVDMNGVIHAAFHPKHQPPPADENEIIENMFKLMDRLFRFASPRRLLYIAIDGVAPQAKVNQQRVRRFRESKREMDKKETVDKMRASLKSKGRTLPYVKVEHNELDSNCITPGTEFMFRLADCLRYYIHQRLNTDPGWANVMVIVSDANVPGEGEHKIMDFIRRQRSQPDYDTSLRHHLYSADADLLLLGLGLHEKNFTVIREKYVYQKPSLCHVCYELGHRLNSCIGSPQKWFSSENEKSYEYPLQEFVYVDLSVLREHIYKDMFVENYACDMYRCIDDWMMLCLLIKNDFLPSLSALKISENAIEVLVRVYKTVVKTCGSYLTDNGVLNLIFLKELFEQLSAMEGDIFIRRHITRGRRTRDDTDLDDDCLWLDGWYERFYRNRCDNFDAKLINTMSLAYISGLVWILKYFKQDCMSWDWYYPYHFAPFACDLAKMSVKSTDILDSLDFGFPLKTLEHLMKVLPPTSGQFLPESWASLMTNPSSSIKDLYCAGFTSDLRNLKIDSEGEIILPFVESSALLEALKPVYPNLTELEIHRNSAKLAEVFVGSKFAYFESLKKEILSCRYHIVLDKMLSGGLAGFAIKSSERCKTVSSDSRIFVFSFMNPVQKPGYIYKRRV